ncbi:PAS domain-containing sensor histidine kinase [Bartonella tamiae]|uniref:histidine kinase n=1 Tax=Bartonella tamiae Th239 TaxID=1094558 RepID=J0R5Y4_9HYPH|nr:PAS domain-containing sensor histidine kinase [Bartonella tamiae]EJF91109.1 hypothetical protein ME5_00441 [Bartonella tamiae Th239]EJF93226.1 hypothetical protein MEG_01440 [Bartonella tamiae Th307]
MTGMAGNFWLALTVFSGLLIFIFLLIAEKILSKISNKLFTKNHYQQTQNTDSSFDDYQKLFTYTGQSSIVWDTPLSPPLIIGQFLFCKNDQIKEPIDEIFRFEQWVEDNDAHLLEDALLALREDGKTFTLYVESKLGTRIHVHGLIVGSAAVAHFTNVSHFEENHTQLECADRAMRQIYHAQIALFNALDEPVWIKDKKGSLLFANNAYRDAYDHDEDMMKNVAFFNETTRQKITEGGPLYKGLGTAIIKGERRSFQVSEIRDDEIIATFAHDMSVTENLSDEIKYMKRGYSETLDQISTAVAIFSADQKLIFFNHAFAILWPLDTAFLESEPSHTLLLDRLRTDGIIAEPRAWREWKDDLFSAYHSVDSHQHIWNLPDGRTVRVLASPHPQGGVTWLFENLTEKIDLERRYNDLIKMQGETLDHLSEGVGVFGSDGRVRLSNPALAKLWSLSHEFIVEGTHISKIQAQCAPFVHGDIWDKFTTLITGFAEVRETLSGRIDLVSGAVFDYALVPLPNAQTMLTFVNVTDSVNITRALEEKNEALESADRLRNKFVQHVSYELRTPLTNIMGFSDILSSQIFGALNDRQLDYLKHIGSESSALSNIVDDILDLATLDAGIMQLDLKDVNIDEVMAYAVERANERLGGRPVQIVVTQNTKVTKMLADPGRLRQIFINILNNAVNFAPDGTRIDFQSKYQENKLIFEVHDEGCGIPEHIIETVFQRFSSHAHNGSRAGAGLGLSIVKSFVELHGGEVVIKTGQERGTTVVCSFPLVEKTE